MEDSPGNIQSDLSDRRLPRPSKRNPRWTLLFVGDHGQTVSVRRFKGVLYLLVALLLLALGTAGGLYLVNRQTVAENHRLAAEVGRLRSEVSSLRYDKDVLTARLVLTEAEVKKHGGSEEPAPEEKTQDEQAGGESSAEQPPAAEPERSDSGSAASEAAAGSPPPEAAVPSGPSEGESDARAVSVENLEISREQDPSLVRVNFIIRKDDPEPESVSGHAFVVLKPEGDSSPEDWVTMPSAAIESGRPSPVRRGQYFSIARFKPMKFERRDMRNPGRFDQATVFVFNTHGQLLLKQDFRIPEAAPDAG